MSNERLTPVRYRIEGSQRAGGMLWDHIEARQRPDGSLVWVATDGHSVVTRTGEWEWEPQPSSRTDAFRDRTRFPSPERALAAYDHATEASNR